MKTCDNCPPLGQGPTKKRKKTHPYDIYKEHLKCLADWYAKNMQENFTRYSAGKRTRGEILEDRHNRLFKRLWWNLKATIKDCCHCHKQPEVISNIDCGIDGGPGPVTLRGVQLKCDCGMRTDIHENYPSDDLQLKCFEKAIVQWNCYK